MASIELQGVDEVLATIRNKLQSGVDRVENRGLRAAGEPVAGAMRQKLNRSDKSGPNYVHMQDDIRVSGVRRRDGAKFVLVGPGPKTGWRAHFLENGTRKMAARPFIYPSFHEKKREVFSIMAEEFRKGLRDG